MTILIYNYHELEERSSKKLKLWKGWHITLYIFAAVFGILNYNFFISTEQLFDKHCVLFPRKLVFHIVELPNGTLPNATITNATITNATITNATIANATITNATIANDNIDKISVNNDNLKVNNTNNSNNVNNNNKSRIDKRDIKDDEESDVDFKNNSTSGNTTHRLVLHVERTLFQQENECQFPMYMPILSAVFALVWATLFIMCPGGGLTRSGLRQPWRILFPALMFATIMVGLTGHSFMRTNSGLQALCASFYNVTNTTACSAVDDHLEQAWNVTWGVGGRIAATRAACAGVLASWACACALLLARCLAAPDFALRRTNVHVKEDPNKKITPFLQKSPKKRKVVLQSPVSSLKSEPTLTSELVTASIEQTAVDSCPTSSNVSPIKRQSKNPDEELELVYMFPREKK